MAKVYNKECKYCNSPFKTTHKEVMYCSKSCSGKNRYKFNIDRNVYKDGWDEDNSYLFGLIMSDGCLTKNKDRNIIVIYLNDEDIVYKLHNYVECKRNVYHNKKQNGLYYWNEDAVKFLIENELEPRKSLSLRFPNIPREYIRDFVRGFFDGDGSVVFRKTIYNTYVQVSIVCGSEEFLLSLQNVLKEENINSKIYDDKRSNAKYLKIISINDCKKFYHYIYDEANFFMARKKKKYDKINSIEYKYSGMI